MKVFEHQGEQEKQQVSNHEQCLALFIDHVMSDQRTSPHSFGADKKTENLFRFVSPETCTGAGNITSHGFGEIV